MSESVTLQDIYALFQRSQAEADRRFAEADRRAAESKAEADRRAEKWEKQLAESRAEADRRAAEWEKQLAASKAEADRRAAEWDRRAAESAERLAQLEVLVAQATQAVNGLTSRWGQFVENFVAPGVVQIFQDWGIQVYKTAQRVKASQGGQHIEIDVLATNGHEIVMVEVKSRLTQKHVRQCLKNLERFKTFFPEYKDHCLYGAIAAIEIDEQVDSFAHKQGLFVIQQAGNNIAISNPPTFKPRTW